MNFLFSGLQSLFVAVVIYVVIAVFCAMFRVVPPKKVRFGVPAIFFGISLIAAAQTYGPRIALTPAAKPPTPEVVEVESGRKMVDPKDRSKVFSDQLEE